MSSEAARVSALSATRVKGLRIVRHGSLELEREGARGDRSYLIVDDRGRMVNAKRHHALTQVLAETGEAGSLVLRFPGGRRVEGEEQLGEPMSVRFYGEQRDARPLLGPFSQALSDHAGAPLRIVAFADGSPAVDRGAAGAVTLVSEATVAALARAAGEAAVDARRFRMTIEIEGVEAFAEDAWIGREVRIGEAVVRPLGHVGRCLITSLQPDTGELDLPTLDVLREMRDAAETTEPLALGVHCAVLVAGPVRVGDAVEVGERERGADLSRSR